MSSRDGMLSGLRNIGYEAKFVSVDRLSDAREEIEGLRREGLLSEELYRGRLLGFTFEPPASLKAESILIIARSSPQARLAFRWKGSRHSVVVPPTYLHHAEIDSEIEREANRILGKQGYAAVTAKVPEKLMAVRSGLALYGRNNICYVPGMGSFTQISALFTDVPCFEDGWRESSAMERCTKCTACVRACPTGAIDADRFLIHAERCLTFHNEETSEFPEWIDSSWHNCLVGCMHCQWACPENREVRDFIVEGGEFSEEETGHILGNPDSLPPEVLSKLGSMGLRYLLDVLPRNLRVLVDQTNSWAA